MRVWHRSHDDHYIWTNTKPVALSGSFRDMSMFMRTSYSTVRLPNVPCVWTGNRNTSMEIVDSVHFSILAIGPFPHCGLPPENLGFLRTEPWLL